MRTDDRRERGHELGRRAVVLFFLVPLLALLAFSCIVVHGAQAPLRVKAPAAGAPTTGPMSGGREGRGSGSGSVANRTPFTVTGDLTAPLLPGAAPEPVDVTIHNPYDQPIDVTGITVSVASDRPGCSAANFAATPFHGSAVVPPATAEALEVADPGAAAPTVAMVETGTDQDPCAGAPLTLTYEATTR